jgi:hypothetical protein
MTSGTAVAAAKEREAESTRAPRTPLAASRMTDHTVKATIGIAYALERSGELQILYKF